MKSLWSSIQLLQKLFALRKAIAAAQPSLKIALSVWKKVGAHLWDEIERKAADADGLTLEEMVELGTHFLEHDLPALIGPPRNVKSGE